jgi:hypothetical protein
LQDGSKQALISGQKRFFIGVIMQKSKLTKEQEQEFKKLYPTTPNKTLAEMFSASIDFIGKKAHQLGVKKDKEYLTQICQRENTGQFKKGHVSHNKGKKGVFFGSVRNQFKKGHQPHNTRNIGAEKEDKYGYVWVKIGTGKTKYERWKPKHHIFFGEPVPKGMILIFKDGNKRNFDKSNLELISRSENMKRNTIYRYPQPIIDLIRINKKFQRKISEAENA